MVDFLLFCFASVGMTLIIVRGSLFQPFREALGKGVDRIQRRRVKKSLPPSFTLVEFLHDLVRCTQCMGFWCGLFCGLFLLTSDTFWMGWTFWSARFLFNRLLMLFCCGAAASFLATVGDILLEWMFFGKILRERAVLDDDRRREAESPQEIPVDPVENDDSIIT